MAMNWGKTVTNFKTLVVCRVVLVVGFLSAALFIYVTQFIAYYAIRPWNEQILRKIDSYLFSDTALNYFAFLLQWWSQCKLELLADSDLISKFGKENALIIFNHRYEIDFITIYSLASHFGSLGILKYFVKKSVSEVPIIGKAYKVHENIFLERVWEKDKENLELQLTEFLKQPEPRIYAMFPEGTRFTSEKHQVSMTVANDKGLRKLKHHLLPRTKGFVECMKIFQKPGFPQVAIYDGFIAVNKNNEGGYSLMDLLKGKGVNIKILLKRYSTKDIPKDDKDCASWVHERFHEKDGMMENFLETGNILDDDGVNEGQKLISMCPQISVLAKFIVWNIFMFGVLLLIFWRVCLILGTELTGVIGLSLFGLGYLGVLYLDNQVKIEMTSSYGTKYHHKSFVVSNGG